MPHKIQKHLNSFILLPHLRLITYHPQKTGHIRFITEKTTDYEVCPHCATKAYKVHDRRRAVFKDHPIFGKSVLLEVIKRRFRCPRCHKVFTEPISGIAKHCRSTRRYERGIRWASSTFMNLKAVQKHFRCSAGKCFQATYDELKRRRRRRLYPLPTRIGVDEHSFHKPKFQGVQYNTILVDHNNKRLYEVFEGRSWPELYAAWMKLEGRERVHVVTLDFSSNYRRLVHQCLPNAEIVVDRFHAQRLFLKELSRLRRKVTGDVRKNPIRKLLLRNHSNLKTIERRAVWKWLDLYPEVKEAYEMKEMVRAFYCMRNRKRAERTLVEIILRLKRSNQANLKALGRLMANWKKEILGYHKWHLTNARCEGFNRKAKLCQRSAFGFRSFENYRFKLLDYCA